MLKSLLPPALGILLLIFGEAANAAETFDTSTVEIVSGAKKHTFIVEIAETPALRQIGLMGRKNLPLNTGMLFIFETSGPVQMWMKDTYVSLDMMFADTAGRIVDITTRTEPLSTRIISSRQPAKYVLEVRGGTVERLNIRAGDRLHLGQRKRN